MSHIVLNLSLGTQKVITIVEIHRLLHDIPQFFYLLHRATVFQSAFEYWIDW